MRLKFGSRITICILIISLMCECFSSLFVSIGFAAESILHEDFESYAVGNLLKNVGYARWHGASVDGDSSNKYLKMLRDDPSVDARFAKDYTTEPEADKVIVSLDFMMPDDPSYYDAYVFGVLSNDGNKESAYIHLENGNLYDGKTTSSNVVRSGLKQGVWYSAFLLVDLENDTYKLYSGGYESEVKDFQSTGTTMTDILFHVRVHNFEHALYFDNVDISIVTQEKLDIALLKAKGLLNDSEVGYTDGKYPQTAFKMLKDKYDEVAENVAEGVEDADADEYADTLDEAISKFKNSKIDTAVTDGIARYIKFNIPDEIAVSESGQTVRTLSATLCDKANEVVAGDISWELKDEYDGVEINGNQLRIDANTTGNIVIKAFTDELYDEKEIALTEGKIIENYNISNDGNTINVYGEFNGQPTETVNIRIVGDDEGNSINVTDTLSVDTNGKFSYSKTVAQDAPYQTMIITIWGDDTSTTELNAIYYGQGLEEAMLLQVNDASSADDIVKFVNDHYVFLKFDKELFEKYSVDFAGRIYNKGSDYQSFQKLMDSFDEAFCICTFADLTSENAEENINAYMSVLVGKGFNKDEFDSLSPSKKTIFYAETLKLELDVYRSSIFDIASDLNAIIEDVKNQPEKEPYPSAVYESVFFDDYENYKIGNTLGGGTYGVRQGVKVSGDENNQYMEVLRDTPMEDGETFGGDNNKTNARITKEFENEPAENVIVSIDFLMTADPYEYSAEIFGVMNDDGNSYAANILLQRGVLYDGRQISSTPLKNDFVKGKWYNAFLMLDLVNNKYTLYCGDKVSETRGFQGKVVNMTNRLFMVRVRNYNNPLYVDNVDIVGAKHPELAVAMYRAMSLMKNSEIGYKNGQYPQTAYNMLKNTYDNTVMATSCNSITKEQANAYTKKLNDIIDNFLKNKIDESGAIGTPSYIKFDIPSALGIKSDETYTRELNATVYDTTNNEVNKDITWTLEKEVDGVSISGNTLSVAPGITGNIVVKAIVGDVYDLHPITLTTCKVIKNLDVDSRDGQLKITGRLDEATLEDVKVKVVGGGINVDGSLSINVDGSFSWTKDVSKSEPFGFVDVTLEGEDFTKTTMNVPFYGVGWKDAVVSEFNESNSSQKTDELIRTYYIGMNLDMNEYGRYSDTYSTRVFNSGNNYTNYTALENRLSDLKAVVGFDTVTRTNIEELTNKHMDTLVRNGFKKTTFDRFTKEQKLGFYASLVSININVASTEAKDIVNYANSIVAEIVSNSKTEESSGSSGGSGGGSYSVNLVQKTTQENTTQTTTDSSNSEIQNFEDVNLAPWASEALLFVRQKGIMVGDGKNVRPTDAITRGEFAKILCVAFNLTSNNEFTFGDSKDMWWSNFASTAKAYGIMNGVEANVFGGEQFITRQMLAVAIDKALSTTSVEYYDQNSGIVFNDNEAIAEYAKASVEKLAKIGIISGIGEGIFAPEAPVKRAEAAQIIYNVLNRK